MAGFDQSKSICVVLTIVNAKSVISFGIPKVFSNTAVLLGPIPNALLAEIL